MDLVGVTKGANRQTGKPKVFTFQSVVMKVPISRGKAPNVKPKSMSMLSDECYLRLVQWLVCFSGGTKQSCLGSLQAVRLLRPFCYAKRAKEVKLGGCWEGHGWDDWDPGACSCCRWYLVHLIPVLARHWCI